MDIRTDAHYPSVQAFIVDATRAAEIKENETYVDGELNTKKQANWYGLPGCTGLKYLEETISSGWEEGLKRAQKASDKIDTTTLTPVDRRRRIHRSDMGDHLDIGSVYAGRHNTAWTTARRKEGLGPQPITIVCNSICSGGDDADVLFWRGAAVTTLTDALESAGYMVRVVVGFGGNHYGNMVSCRITAKDYGMPLDTSTASSVILPGFFRGLGHAWIHRRSPKETRCCGISVEECKTSNDEIMCSHEVKDLKSAQKWALDVIQKIENGDFKMADMVV